MIAGFPDSLSAAITWLAEKKALPTVLGTADLRLLDKQLRQKSLFSARTLSGEYLEVVRQEVGKVLSGEADTGTARANLQTALNHLSFTPQKHFGTPDEAQIPPAEEGSLQDLSSDSRIDLVVNTNMRMAANMGAQIAGNDEDALWLYPCWELLRIYSREVPRGFKHTKEGLERVPGDDWFARWTQCGGKISDGRLIARKDDPLWHLLGDSSLFDDGTDSEVPPYAFNSGFDRLDVERDEAVRLGVIGADDEVGPADGELTGKLLDQPGAATLADAGASKEELRKAFAEWMGGVKVKVTA